mgnify:CR=1 FL=1|tara:strand:- start:10354 stop:11244 length:891 start_codon:yes stop_codon:yes gene_type:complete
MENVGIVGLGDMGSGFAKNLINKNFSTMGIDLNEKRMKDFIRIGGVAANSLSDLGKFSDIVFVMVMDGNQANEVILNKNGLIHNLKKNSTIILTSTIKPLEAKKIGEVIKDTNINFIDSPVSGGFAGAQNGTLTMMAAGEKSVIEKSKSVMNAISNKIHHIGSKPGEGQTVKACLQSLIGSIFTATIEAAALAAKAGIKGETLLKVFSTSGAGCNVTNSALENIIDRKFYGTGSSISTMHKDLIISLNLAENLGVPLHTASTAMQLFHAGKTKYPDGDNWIISKVIEEIIGAELHR